MLCYEFSVCFTLVLVDLRCFGVVIESYGVFGGIIAVMELCEYFDKANSLWL